MQRVAGSLGGATRLRLGPHASETAVKSLDLASYRILSFATHGLLPGQLRCDGEPALVLTPPGRPSDADDGLLDASEVAAPWLDADWVVLSACNTAAGSDSLSGDSLAGLAGAFIRAGGRRVAWDCPAFVDG